MRCTSITDVLHRGVHFQTTVPGLACTEKGVHTHLSTKNVPLAGFSNFKNTTKRKTKVLQIPDTNF